MTNRHVHYMYNRALRNYYDMEQARTEMKIEKDRMEMEDVTFQPRINEKSRKIAENTPTFMERAFRDIEQN